MAKQKNNFYAYQINDGPAGICQSWSECEEILKGKSARYKGFPTQKEAKNWLEAGAQYQKKQAPKLEEGVYFDAGTGRGDGVELKVTDKNGKNLLSKEQVNTAHETHKPEGQNRTNNYGELLGAKFALELALKEGHKKIFGDSKLVLDFWSKGAIKKDKVSQDTVDLAMDVVQLRKEFENSGGQMFFVSGDHNPADLGFHK